MRIVRILAPVHALGPGVRVCLWIRGCSKHCKGCISSEMQEFAGPDTGVDAVAKLVRQAADQGKCSRLTISGGDPLEQPEALYEFLKLVRNRFSDILVYTGWTLEEIKAGVAGEKGIKCLDLIDVLVDGRYLESNNHPGCVLRGSDNQTIWFLNDSLQEEYNRYIEQGRTTETFEYGNERITVGIMNNRS